MQGHHHLMSGGSVPVGSMGQQGMEIHSSGHGFLSPHQAGGVSAMQMQMMPNVSHSMGIPNPHLPMHRVAPVPVATSVRHHHQASGGGVGMSRGHGAHGSALYGAPDTSMMMPISIQGGSGGGMIDLCDLQPTISAAQVGHNKPPELQGLEMLVSGVQQDASFLSAVSARQPDAAAIAAVIRMKAMLAQNPTLLHAMTGRHQAAGGNVEALYQNQRVVVQAHKKTPARFVGQEGVVVTPPVNEWLVLRVAQTGEVIRIHQRCVSPISHSDMLSIPHHDLIDNDDLDALPDIDLLGDGDIVLDAGISSTNPHHHHHQHQHQHQHQHSNTAIATGHGSMQHQLPGPGMPASHEVVTAFHGGNDGGAGGGGGGGGGGGVVGGGDGGGGELGLPEMEVAPPAEAVMSLEEQRELFRTVQADLLALEAKVPWALAKLSWQQARPSWAETLRGCCTLDECAYALQLLYRSLHLSKEEAAKGSDGGGGGHGGLAALMKALTVRLASGRPVATFLRQHWAEARGELERWLERRSGGGQLAALEGGLLKAIVALEGAAGEGEEAALQVPLEAIVGRNAESLSVLKDVLERERAELVSKATQLWTGPDPTELPHERLTYEATEKASFVELLATRLQLHRSSANGHRPGAEDDNVSETTDLDDSDMEDTM